MRDEGWLKHASARVYLTRRADESWQMLKYGRFKASELTDAYVSAAVFGSARNAWLADRKGGYKVADNIIRRIDTVIDLDYSDEIKRNHVIKSLQDMGLGRDMHMIKTGRGWHIWCLSAWELFIKRGMPEVHGRNAHIIKAQRRLCTLLKRRGCVFDTMAAIGVKRIFRLKDSRHGKTGAICSEIPIPDLRNQEPLWRAQAR